MPDRRGALRRRLRGRLRLGPVVELLAAAAAGLEAAHVRALCIGALELLVRRVAVLIPLVVVLLGDAEVDERSAPDVCKAHGCRDVSGLRWIRWQARQRSRGRFRPGYGSLLL